MSDSEAVDDVKFQGVSNCEAEMKLSYQVITSLIEKSLQDMWQNHLSLKINRVYLVEKGVKW